MAEDTPTGERTEAPSAKRRADFRNKGQVAQSREVQTAAMFTILLLFWLAYAPHFWRQLDQLLTSLWAESSSLAITPPNLMQFAYFLFKQFGLLLLPLFLITLATGFLSSYIQIGWLFTTQPLMPDLAKLDPIKGMGKFFPNARCWRSSNRWPRSA